MRQPAYYNELDKKAAAWLRELIQQGHIAPGDVDERDIRDVVPNDLVGYTQCHFFAGIGVWSYALRRAEWPDDRAIWTASCPCQPFSQAGEGAGFADERHLWPHLYHLIGQRRPGIVIGEQVASRDADAWIDLVQADMEALGHAFGAVAFPSAGVGAPHIRDRTYWVAYAAGERPSAGARVQSSRYSQGQLERPRMPGHPGNASNEGLAQRIGFPGVPSIACGTDAGQAGSEREQRSGEQRQQPQDHGRLRMAPGATFDADTGAGPVNGLWRDADWLFCRDGKWRPVEPGTFPLAHGSAARVGRLRGYGNAINAEAAKAFIEAVMESA